MATAVELSSSVSVLRECASAAAAATFTWSSSKKSSAGGAAALTVELERGARVEHAARAGVKKGSTRATIASRIVK